MSANAPKVEYAGGVGIAGVHASRRGIIERAPAWWRSLAERNAPPSSSTSPPARPAPPKPKPAATRSRKYAGWVSGVACVGVSIPAYCAKDRRQLPEQFTAAGLASMVATAYRSKQPVELQWGHDGEILASTIDLDLTFRVDHRYGLCFDARLADTPLARKVLGYLERGLLGVSIAYGGGEGWLVERDGIGTVRVVDGAKLAHVALLEQRETLRPAYPACYASGRAGDFVGPPSELRWKAESRAWEELVRQASGVVGRGTSNHGPR